MISHTSLDVYDLGLNLQDLKPEEIRSIQLLPGEVCKVRIKETKEIVELDSKDIWPHKHTLIRDGKEVNMLNRRTRQEDPNNPLPSSEKFVETEEKKKEKRKKDPRD